MVTELSTINLEYLLMSFLSEDCQKITREDWNETPYEDRLQYIQAGYKLWDLSQTLVLGDDEHVYLMWTDGQNYGHKC